MMYVLYVERESLLHSLDPRVKIIGMIAGIVSVMLFNDPTFLIPIFFLVILVGKVFGKLGVYEQIRLLKPLTPIVVITLLLWPVIYEPRLKGLLFGVAFSLRLLTFASLTFLVLLTTRQRDLILGFVKLGLPYELGLTISIALRYIPTLYALTVNIMDAQRSRGLEFDRGNVFQRIHKMTAVLVPLLVSSLKTAHELGIAIETRAFGASKRRTFLYDIAMGYRDYVAMLIVVLLFFVAVYVRYSLGLGYLDIYG